MHRPTHQELQGFYHSTLGALVYNRVKSEVYDIWRDIYESEKLDLTVLGVGFATQYLNPLVDKKLSVISLAPKSQGAECWPKNHQNMAIIGRDAQLPFADNSVDRIIVAHCLEFARNPHETMQEIWRVLSPQGKVIVIVPNRGSVWSRSENTVFGYGRPFSLLQTKNLLNDTDFAINCAKTAVHFPPSQQKLLLKAAQYIHKINKLSMPKNWGGIVIIEAEKNIASPTSGHFVGKVKKLKIYKPATNIGRGIVKKEKATNQNYYHE